MLPKRTLPSLILVGMTLGTAWAIRGQFGHEQGAAWAGGIGALAILVLANREDWYAKLFKATLAGAIGWGIGGVMSYGIVVGYGHGIDLGNVYYGFLMLFVIGGLYGFMGGGLFGLALENSPEKPVAWASLATQMIAGGLLIYGLFIYQWEWLMTPPRSEAWAGCLGMAFALIWYMKRSQFSSALRVAIFSGIGAGFGFACGNFLQVLGKFSESAFNFWNVMEYSLGFFGGLGMAYGVFSADWKKTQSSKQVDGHLLAGLLLCLFIPIVIWTQSFSPDRLQRTFEKILTSEVEFYVSATRMAALLLMLLFGGLISFLYFRKRKTPVQAFHQKESLRFFALYFAFYLFLSWMITGALFSTYRPEQYLYIINWGIILFFISRVSTGWIPPRRIPLFQLLGAVLIILGLLALIAIQTHGPFEGMHQRFGA